MFAVQPLFPHGVPMFAVQPLFPHYSSTPGTSSREQKEKEVFWQGEYSYLCLLFNLYFLIILALLGPYPGNKRKRRFSGRGSTYVCCSTFISSLFYPTWDLIQGTKLSRQRKRRLCCRLSTYVCCSTLISS